ncbi:MAG: DNA recombination protein RmuC, partial [Spirochaetales bacterium]|nr:DNA recombination protein RmuC [Spirochaetales bacterium]
KERVISEARDINKKYILPPETTDFAILFLPAESIYAELLRMEGLVERLQSEFRVILTGPNNFAALLNSLSLGFRTLQIEQYTSKIWKNFEVLKKYFADLSKAIDESKKAVDKASDSLDSASKKKDKLSTVLVSMESTADKISFANAEFIESD